MRTSEDSQRAESARIELNGVRAQAYYALKRIAWEKEYLLEQLTLLEDQKCIRKRRLRHCTEPPDCIYEWI